MLRATRRVLRRGGVTAFTTIFPAPGLTGATRRWARASAPPHGVLRTNYPSLLHSARFVDVVEFDVTRAYRATQRAWLEESEGAAAELSRILGEEEFTRLQTERRAVRAAIEAGLLRRSIYVARRPP